MKRRLTKMLGASAPVIVILAVVYFRDGTVPNVFLYVIAAFLAVFLAFGYLEDARDRRLESGVITALSALGGSATLSELEGRLFDAKTDFARVQRHRDAIERLRDAGRIAEVGDRLLLSPER